MLFDSVFYAYSSRDNQSWHAVNLRLTPLSSQRIKYIMPAKFFFDTILREQKSHRQKSEQGSLLLSKSVFSQRKTVIDSVNCLSLSEIIT